MAADLRGLRIPEPADDRLSRLREACADRIRGAPGCTLGADPAGHPTVVVARDGRTVAEVRTSPLAGLGALAGDGGGEEEHEARAPRSAARVVGVDLLGGVGDLLVERAAEAVDGPVRAMHVALAAGEDPRLLLPDGAAALARPVVERVAGEDVRLLAGEGRRLAWFPRPVGARHAVATAHVATVLRTTRRPTLDAAGSHVALRAWRGELVQLAAARATAGRAATGSGLVDRVASRRRTGWTLVAEAHGDDDEVERCWARGADDAAATAALVALLVEVFTAAALQPPSRPLGVADVLEPAGALDRLAADGVLTWGRVPPARAALRSWRHGRGPAAGDDVGAGEDRGDDA